MTIGVLNDVAVTTILAVLTFLNIVLDQSAGAVEYTDCISVERWETSTPRRKCLAYDTKKYVGEVPVML